ncbi:DUF302 domain-containing protein [Cytobacillus sp. S13-E01]|uniref:DUF302 domain-containing protein n=1 Tax=Cytobacillus sp. S13-E01 TaxID=3031326 RepID=UPI0023D84E3B|nr:DUF302 domain-containing protein [Cytobacillus sp. S13-E01]MDF0728093.1 DUF302 domain-containing protein [Cytobacillus sp. S13-E01]
MFHYTKEIQGNVKETVTKLEESLAEEGFGVLWNLDLRNKLQEKGIDFDNELMILEVCNPHEAKKVLDEEILVSYFLPCKIVVYNESSTTKIGMPKPSLFMQIIDNEKLKEIAEDIENRLINCINKV